jgi:hypothetical protein
MVELSMPLHTLIELEPRPDGTMVERRYKINIDSVSDDDVRAVPLLLFALHQCITQFLPRLAVLLDNELNCC